MQRLHMRHVKLKIVCSLFITLVVVVVLTPFLSQGEPDYQGMVDRIGVFLGDGLTLYKAGDVGAAKEKVQAAYFEVFENLEGPIRINISARKNYELEEEFAGIRKMVKTGQPYEAISRRINSLMDELHSVVGELEGGYKLVAEAAPGNQIPPKPNAPASSPPKIEPVWQAAVDRIQSKLEMALEAYRLQQLAKANDLVVKAQYDDYKNGLLETAVRQYVSQSKDYENNAGFTKIIGMINNSESAQTIASGIANLVAGIQRDLPGLPLVEGIASSPQIAKPAGPDRDWARVASDILAAIQKAVVHYQAGDREKASEMVQDSYFDIFEASGMEAKIGARDADLKAAVEGHFSMMAAQMKKGAAAAEIKESVGALQTDLDRVQKLLASDADSAYALFFYSLMIILREGFEAILIITAIIAYLSKTGHTDKIKVIYNACMAAIVISILTAVLVKWGFKASAASREILEGFTMLLAAGVLFGVSYWLISKAEAQKWMAFIKDKVQSSLSTGSLRALWFTVFLAVYREGAETVLFYQALVSGQTAMSLTAIGAGFAGGCVLLSAIYLLMRYSAIRLPIRPFFIGTGALLYYMAFVFAGKGVMELIEGKLFDPSLITWLPTVSLLGLYPYWQTLIPQLVLVVSAAAALAFVLKQKAALRYTADMKS